MLDFLTADHFKQCNVYIRNFEEKIIKFDPQESDAALKICI